jgi:hypothetical protein
MADPDKPSPKRKSRAAIVIVAIGLLMIVAIFVGMNLQHAEELEENPTPAATPSN